MSKAENLKFSNCGNYCLRNKQLVCCKAKKNCHIELCKVPGCNNGEKCITH